MDGLHMPPNPSTNVLRSTPDNGILYVAGSNKSIVYVTPSLNSESEPNSTPWPVKIISWAFEILTIECDPNWTNDRKHFAVMDNHFCISIWNLNNCERVLGHYLAHRYSNRNSALAMCYTNNDQVLSIVGKLCVKFCVKSNAYEKYSLNPEWRICILKISPYDDNIVAAGTKSGQVLLLDTKDFSLLHTLCGHKTEIISIEWIKFKSTVATFTVKKPVKYTKKKQLQLKANNIDTKNVTVSNSANVKISNIKSAENLNLNEAEPTIKDNILSDINSINSFNFAVNSDDIDLADNGSNAGCLIGPLDRIRNAEKFCLIDIEQMLKNNILSEPNSTSKILSYMNSKVKSDDTNSANNDSIAESSIEILANIQNTEKLNLTETGQTFKDNILSNMNSINNLNSEVKSDDTNSASNDSIAESPTEILANTEKLNLTETGQTFKDNILSDMNSIKNLNSEVKLDDTNSASNDSIDESLNETLQDFQNAETVEHIQNTDKFNLFEIEQAFNDDNLPELNFTDNLNLEVKSDKIDSEHNETNAKFPIETLQTLEKFNLNEVDQTLKDNISTELNFTDSLNLKVKSENIKTAQNDDSFNGTLQNAEEFNSIEAEQTLKDDDLSKANCAIEVKSDDIDLAHNASNAECLFGKLENIRNDDKLYLIEIKQLLKGDILDEMNLIFNSYLQVKSDDIDSGNNDQNVETLENIDKDEQLNSIEFDEIFQILPKTNFINNFNLNGIDSVANDSTTNCQTKTLQNISNVEQTNLNENNQTLKGDDLTESNSTRNLHLKLKSNDIHSANTDSNAEFVVKTLPNLKKQDQTLKPNECKNDFSQQKPMEFEEKICIASSSMIDNNIWLWDTKTGVGMEKIVMKKYNHNFNKDGNKVCIKNSICWINNSMLAVLSLLDCGITIIDISYIGNNRFTIKIKEIGCEKEFDVGIIQNQLQQLNVNDSRPPIWTFTRKHDRQLVFGDIDSNYFNIKGSYSTMSLTHCSIQECPNDRNKIVIGGNGYKFYIFNIASFSSNYCQMIPFMKEHLSQIGSIVWHPTNKNILAYSTAEGIVAIIDISKNTNKPLFLTLRTNQFCHISWGHIGTINDDNNATDQSQRIVLFVCRHQKLYYYPEDTNYKKKLVNNTNDASTVNVGKHFIAVGSTKGGLSLYTFQLKCLWYAKITQKCITYCAWSSIAPNRLAISSQANDIILFTICADGDSKEIIHTDGTLVGHKYGVNMVKWSDHNENHLVSCSNDCTVRVWDADKFVCISLVTYSFVMSFAIFSPHDGNLVLATGHSETMHIFDIRNHLFGSKSKKQNYSYQTAIHFQWAKDCTKKIVVNKTKHKKVAFTKEMQKVAITANKSGSNHSNNVEPSSSQMIHTTILPLSTEELNKNAVQSIRSIINPDTDGKLALHSHLYSTHENVKKLLEIELQNHKDSNTLSIAHVLIPQLCGNLQMDILKNIDSKTLSESHIALASSISYEFWKKCCKAYANQCIEKNMTLQAIPYLLGCHKYNESIDALCAGNMYPEAWIIAKLYKDIDDISSYNSITTQWITYLESQGNLDGAALVAASVDDYETAISMLSKGNLCEQKKTIIERMKDLIK